MEGRNQHQGKGWIQMVLGGERIHENIGTKEWKGLVARKLGLVITLV